MPKQIFKNPGSVLFTTIIFYRNTGQEQTGRTTNLNIFSSALSVEQMKLQTTAGEKECGLAGDFLSWEKSLEGKQWTLHSKARFVELDGGLESPCMTKARMNIFPMTEWHYHSDCMEHCKKLGGRSPPVTTEQEWENLLKENNLKVKWILHQVHWGLSVSALQIFEIKNCFNQLTIKTHCVHLEHYYSVDFP